jgi:hypothetical protein
MSQIIDLFTRQPIEDEPEDKPFDIRDWANMLLSLAGECQK